MVQNNRAIIFDFGNVLLDWNVRYLYRQFFHDEQSLSAFLDEIHFYQWNLQLDAGKPFETGIRELSEMYPHWAEKIRLYDERYPESVRGPIQGSANILLQLNQQGWPLFGLSNFNGPKFHSIRSQYPFFDVFCKIILSGEVGVIKPDPTIFQILLREIGYRPENCVFIDDSQPNIQTATTLGFDAILFKSPEDLARELALRGIEVTV